METITLITPLKVTTDINTSNRSGVGTGAIAGATAGVTEEFLIE